MIDIGINYITEIEDPKNRYDDIYKFLIKNKYINTIKFPGKYCNYNSLNYILNIVKSEDVKIDIHGLPDMIPSIHSKNFIENVKWEELNKTKLRHKNITRISTHMGLENKERLIEHRKIEINFKKNINKLKAQMKRVLEYDVEVGAENIPGGFQFDLETLKPDFVSNTWNTSDFGVFDISHAKLASKDLKISYKDYINKIISKEKVKILHISGNIDLTKKYEQKPDKHVLIHETEIKDIIEALNIFKNVDLIISEYAYNTRYTYEKEIIIEAITLFTIVKTKDEKISKKVLKYLEENLKNDATNVEEVINSNKFKMLIGKTKGSDSI